MSESLITVKTGNCKAWVKDELVTDSSEANRQREIWNLSNEAQKSLRELAGLNESEPISSVVNRSPGNWDSGCVEPLEVWRRQYHAPPHPAEVHEHPGVVKAGMLRRLPKRRRETPCLSYEKDRSC